MIRLTKHAQEAIGVHRPEGDDIVIITVHFDRGARR